MLLPWNRTLTVFVNSKDIFVSLLVEVNHCSRYLMDSKKVEKSVGCSTSQLVAIAVTDERS